MYLKLGKVICKTYTHNKKNNKRQKKKEEIWLPHCHTQSDFLEMADFFPLNSKNKPYNSNVRVDLF